MLETLQQLLSRIPGGLSIAVTILGTILAASTGIIGASVVMLGILALPAMLKNNYQTELALGVVCASGTLGILIPPSIMLVLMGDLLSLPVGELFVGALFPGLLLSALYLVYLVTLCTLRPSVAPRIRDGFHAVSMRELTPRVCQSLIPPVAMIALVLGSIFFGWATPTEASGVGALGALLLAGTNRRLNFSVVKDILDRSASTVSMIFTILIGATTFSYVFRSLHAALRLCPLLPEGRLPARSFNGPNIPRRSSIRRAPAPGPHSRDPVSRHCDMATECSLAVAKGVRAWRTPSPEHRHEQDLMKRRFKHWNLLYSSRAVCV